MNPQDKGGQPQPQQPQNKPLGADMPAHGNQSIRIKLDGQVKTVDQPVTGASLHRLAGETSGSPVKVFAGGREIQNDNNPVQVSQDQEFSTHK